MRIQRVAKRLFDQPMLEENYCISKIDIYSPFYSIGTKEIDIII